MSSPRWLAAIMCLHKHDKLDKQAVAKLGVETATGLMILK